MAKKKTVYIRVVFLKVGEIDTIREQFNADVFIQARWLEPELKRDEDLSNITKHWMPNITFSNLLDYKKKLCRHEVDFRENGQTYVYEKHRIKGLFTETMELLEFPFDKQALAIRISSDHPNTVLEFVEETEEISDIEVTCFIDEQEWWLYDFVELSKFEQGEEPEKSNEVTDNEMELFSRKGVNKYPRLFARFFAVRRWGFFMWNIVMIMTLISSVSLATFSVSEKLPQNRLQLSITLMLTSVTFKSVASANLPKISYYTRLDVYVLFSMLFVFVVCIWHAVISLFSGSTQSDLDRGAFIFFCIVFGLFHISYGLFLASKFNLRCRKLKQKEHLYQLKSENIDHIYWKHKQTAHKSRKRKHVTFKIVPDDVWPA